MNLVPGGVITFVLAGFPIGLLLAPTRYPWHGILIVFSIVFVLIWLSGSRENPGRQRYLILAIFSLMVFFGCQRNRSLRYETEAKKNLLSNRELKLEVVFLEAGISNKKSTSVEAEILKAWVNGKETKAAGKILLNIGPEWPWPCGFETAMIQTHVQSLDQKQGAYWDFLQRKGVLFNGKVLAMEMIGIEQSFRSVFFSIRKSIVKAMNEKGFSTKSSALASAMMIGDKSGLDKEIKLQFSKSGLSHILAVSGMHIGIIFQVMWSLMLPLATSRKRRMAITIFSMFLLFCFGILAGSGGSILRAVFMFEAALFSSLFMAGKTGPYGLRAAIFFLLWFDPPLLFDAGFQLSCAAVAGIFGMVPPIQKWLFIHLPYLPKWLNEPMSVTLAAQATTTPFVLWHFGAIPAWFIPANLIAVPISVILMKLGFLTLFLFWIPLLGDVLVWVFTALVEMMAWIAEFFSALPGAQATSFSLADTGMQVLAFWLVLFCFCAFFIRLLKPKKQVADPAWIDSLTLRWAG